MSKYIAFTEIQFKDRALLLDALREAGFPTVEEGVDLTLYGYRGDKRKETAEIVIRRKDIGSMSNDIGFKLQNGSYTPIVSEYDQRYLNGGTFMANLRTKYNELSVQKIAKQIRGSVERRVEGSTIKLRVRF